MKKFVLIDGHALVHRAFHALPPTLNSPSGVLTNAVYGFTSVLMKMIKDLRPEYIAAAFDVAGPTFRHEEFDDYKGHRVKAPDELYAQVPLVQKIVRAFGIPIFEREGYEADDVIGSLAVRAAKQGVQVIIATGDLDTLQLIEGTKIVVCTLRKGVTDTVLYDEKGVRERYGLTPEQVTDFKGLKGDPSDNIPGVPGIGEKTASALIQEFGSIEKLYGALAEARKKKSKKGKTKSVLSEKLAEKLIANKEQAFFSKRLATIVTDLDIPFSIEDAAWRQNADRSVLESTFRDFGFSSLLKRLDETLNGKHAPVPDAPPHDAPLQERSHVETPGTLIGHDTKPHVKELLRQEKEIPAHIFDTRIAAYLLNPDDRLYELDQLLHTYRIPPSPHPEALTRLRRVLEDKLVSVHLEHVFEDIEMPLIKVLAQMELYGITVDPKVIASLRTKAEQSAAQLTKDIYALAGEEFNINSPGQLGKILFERLEIRGKVRRTSGGAISTAAAELEKIRDEHPIVEKILSYREIKKLLTTYIEPFPSLIASDGRVHTTYNQTGAATGRLASENPNLQNIPIKTDLGNEFRRAFVAPRKWRLVSFDYSQLELRIVAHMADDRNMIEAFAHGQDIHTRTASQMFNVAPNDVTKDMRRQAKVLNFGIIYGMGSLGFARAAGVDRARAKEFIERYFKEFSGVARFMEEAKGMAYREGYVQTLFGRRRPLPDARSTMPQLRAQAERMAINHPVQGTEADLIKMAMIHVYDFLASNHHAEDARMLLQVHDELVFEIREEVAVALSHKIRAIMASVHPLKVPLVVDVKIGTNWSDMEPLS